MWSGLEDARVLVDAMAKQAVVQAPTAVVDAPSVQSTEVAQTVYNVLKEAESRLGTRLPAREAETIFSRTT